VVKTENHFCGSSCVSSCYCNANWAYGTVRSFYNGQNIYALKGIGLVKKYFPLLYSWQSALRFQVFLNYDRLLSLSQYCLSVTMWIVAIRVERPHRRVPIIWDFLFTFSDMFAVRCIV